MSRRNTVRIVSFSLAIALFCGIFAFNTKRENDKYALEIENSYAYMVDSLVASADNIATILNKARFVTSSEMQAQLAAKLITETEICKNALSGLPLKERPESLNRFLSQVGNYALSVSRESKEQKGMSDKHTANIENLSENAKQISIALNSVRGDYHNLDYWSRQVEDELEQESFGEVIGEIEDTFTDYPTLIYDGPYSDHILEREALMLKNTAESTKEEAENVACKWLAVSPKNLEFAGESKGKIPTFDFLGEGINISVTKQGGYVLYFRKEKNIKEMQIDYNKALASANEFLSRVGMNDLKETYYFEADGICTINFAYSKDNTLCYTDLIKIGVSMEDGEVVLYEAGGYIANHRERSFKETKYSADKALGRLSQKLTVENVRRVIIPSTALEEKRCYEFICRSADGQDVLVYINTESLREEDILILLKTDGGTLVK